jgi:hypothetical protein
MPSGGAQQTQSQQSGPPQWLQPSLQYGAAQARELYRMPAPQYYPGNAVANPSPATEAGQQAQIAYGLTGNPTANAASGYVGRVLNGDYLTPGNPYQSALNRSIAANVMPSVNAQFSLAGRYGSPDHAGTVASALANAEAPLEYQNYQAERGNQQAAASLAPSFDAIEQNRIAALQGAGAAADQLAQNQVNANVNRWNYDQNLAQDKLQKYLGLLLQPGFGSYSTSTATQPGGGIAGFLGGLLGRFL